MVFIGGSQVVRLAFEPRAARFFGYLTLPAVGAAEFRGKTTGDNRLAGTRHVKGFSTYEFRDG